MSGIVAIVGGRVAASSTAIGAMLAALAPRGGDARACWTDPEGGAVLAVSRARWETDESLAGAARVAATDVVAVVADASLYYRRELRAALRAADLPVDTDDASFLVAAAYEAWGEAGIARLEGDFALVIWDRRRRALVAARDYSGGRPLYHAAAGDGLLVASSCAALVAHPECDKAYDVRALAEAASGFAPADARTCYRAVTEVRAGETVRWSDGRLHTSRHWEAPAFEQGGGAPFRDAAAELRGLLERAVVERLPAGGRGTVWMSGGWDSTAVYAAGRSALANDARGTELLPVSISYPEGDSGREDEYIQAVLDWWDAEGHWVRSDEVPFLAGAADAAARRDGPFAHPYEAFHRALGRASVALGARVAFSGFGGDQLFYVSHHFFADLLRRGRLPALWRAWAGKGRPGLGHFWRFAVSPLLPDLLYRAASAVRGRPVLRFLDRAVPAWIEPGFAHRHDLAASGRRAVARRRGEGFGSHESRWIIDSPFFQRAHQATTGYAWDAGVELRSPLFDRRIIEFAARRPRWERSSGPDTKLLLRAAMAGLLPPGVIASRAQRTGTSESYMRAATRRAYPALVERLARDARLADLGIVEPAAWRAATDQALAGSDDAAVFLYFTIQTELWLRGRETTPRAAAGSAPTTGAVRQ